jgi:hypothetical protein
MARARVIKPELMRNPELRDAEQAAGVSPFTLRTVLQQLILHADGNGCFRWKPRSLRDELLPGDEVDVGRALVALEEGGWIGRYEDEDGNQFGVVRTFLVHQPNAHREPAGTYCPPPPEDLLPPKARRRLREMESVRKGHRGDERKGKAGPKRDPGSIHDRSTTDPDPYRPLDPDHPSDPVDPRPPQPLRTRPATTPPGGPTDDDDGKPLPVWEDQGPLTLEALVRAYERQFGGAPSDTWRRVLHSYLRHDPAVVREAFRRCAIGEARRPRYLELSIASALVELAPKARKPARPEEPQAPDPAWEAAPRCSACDGTGFVRHELCETCDGHGRLLAHRGQAAAPMEGRGA